jgi:hypothetical protein
MKRNEMINDFAQGIANYILEKEFVLNNKLTKASYKKRLVNKEWYEIGLSEDYESLYNEIESSEGMLHAFEATIDSYANAKLDYLLAEGFAYMNKKDYVLYTDDELAHELADVGKYI